MPDRTPFSRTPLPPPVPTAPLEAPPGEAPAHVPLSDVVAALSTALDLTEGQPLGHSARACVIGMRLGRELGLDDDALGALYYALLLKDAGCSSNAARMAALFGADDQVAKPLLKQVDWDDRVALAHASWRAVGRTGGRGAPVWTRVRLMLGLAREDNVTRDIIAARCERGADIARRLGFPAATVAAIASLDEHWNGGGYPAGLAGEAIPLFARILNLAQTAEVFLAQGGSAAALEVLAARRGRWFDPDLVDRVLAWREDRPWWGAVRTADADGRVAALEPQAHARVVDDDGLDQVAEAFAEVIDAKSPFTYAHSTSVARLAEGIAGRLGLDAAGRRLTRRAALLHDIGKVGVSNRILDKRGPLTPEERAVVQAHPRHTWEILGRVRAFAAFARQAATHHEMLDGSGYPWGLDAAALDLPARALVVADIYEALTADRPYRAGMPVEAALAVLQRDRGTRLDAACVDALAQGVGAA